MDVTGGPIGIVTAETGGKDWNEGKYGDAGVVWDVALASPIDTAMAVVVLTVGFW